MKKILVVCAAILMLPCLPLRAQEAEDTGPGVSLSVIPRLDIAPEFNDGSGEFTFGNSSLYTLFEGNITENLSFSVANHWASLWGTDPFGDETKALYNKTFWHSDTNNWLDWAYLEYTTGPWTFTLGKSMMLTGGFECDEYDWDVHPALATSFWNNFQGYQWGGRIGYELWEENVLNLEVTTSPYGERPFSSGLYAFSAGWNGTVGDLQTLWSVSAIQRDDDKVEPLIFLGNRYDLDPVELRLDLSNRVGSGLTLLSKGFGAHASAIWNLDDRFELMGSLAYERDSDFDTDAWIPGAAFHWFPLSDSRDLRVHAFAGYHSLWETTTLGLGVLYNLNLL